MTSGKVPAKAFAVFAVALMLVSLLPVLASSSSETSGYSGDSFVVTYDPGTIPEGSWNGTNHTSTPKSLQVTYYGRAIAEYNPQLWNGNISGESTTEPSNWYGITRYVSGQTLVFTGWSETKGQSHGDVDPGDALDFDEGVTTKTLYACWDVLKEYYPVDEEWFFGNLGYTLDNYEKSDKYLYVLGIRDNIDLGGPVNPSKIGGCTVVTADENGYPAGKSNFNYHHSRAPIQITGEVIIDNVTIVGKDSDTSQSPEGYYANGKMVIIGTNVSCTNYVNLYGGWNSDGDHSEEDTDIRIFSGTYANVIGGSSDGIIGKISTTNVLIAGTTSVIESVIGGSIGDTKNDQRLVDYTNVLVVSGSVNTNGFYDDSKTNIRGDISTIIGGSRFGDVGHTNVEVTNKAVAFAVQGGGRQGTSSAESTTVLITGQAHIIYMVCGSITDGNPNESNFPVEKANVIVCDSPKIDGSVYGGGFDIWALPQGPSVRSVSITIEGEPEIGSVFGGGFRGTVGDGSGTTVSINISGGKIGEVYGGGRGSTDPMINSKGEVNSYHNVVGPAKIEGDVQIKVTGGTIGNLYGGGFGATGDSTNTSCGLVSGNVSLDVEGGVNVTGDIYGGGKGFSNDDGIASVKGNVSISIDNSEVGGSLYGGGQYGSVRSENGSVNITIVNSNIVGDVYGGGKYGLLKCDSVYMILSGLKTTIGGSVYGGGLGKEKVLATDVSERTIVINGPTIHGSVYGGSRDGDDNYTGSDNDVTCTTNIYILSGNVASGSSGNVYGGAYKGRSKMDSNIYIGSAVPEQIGSAISKTFSIHSIFGGASVGEVSNDYNTDTVLLFGDVTINIGGQGYQGSITGNVFGEGDYCKISGTSDIKFTGFSNPEGVSMLSIQKADSVTLDRTELTLDGDVDGNSTSGSAKLSINDVGMLTLVGYGENAKSGLTMNAQVSSLSGYESVHEGEFTDGDKYLTGSMNYLRLNGGKMFSVLGKNNDGSEMTTSTKGVTLFLRDGNPYYGALAISGPSVDSTAEFVLEDGTRAGMTEYSYGSVTVTVWYVAGAFTVDETVNLASGAGYDKTVIGIPKMVSGSEIRYVGHYMSMNSEGSLNIVGDLEGTTPGADFKVMLGTDSDSIHYGNDGLNLAEAGSGTPFSGTGASIGLEISTLPSFSKTGYAGTIHIHMVEVYGGITIGTFDIELAVFLIIPQPVGDEYTIQQDILVKDQGSNQHHGSTDVYLPVLSGGAVGTYTLVSVSGMPQFEGEIGDLVMTLESTYLNKSGWLSRLWDGSALENMQYSTVLGDGGLFSPVLGFDFTCPGHDNPNSATTWDPITITVNVVWSDGGESKSQTYKIILTPKHASERTVSFYDKWLSSDTEYKWKYLTSGGQDAVRLPSFTLSLEFGDSLVGMYVAINIDDLKAAINNESWDIEDYLSKFQKYLCVDEHGHAVTAQTADGISSVAGEGYVAYPVYSYSDSQADLLDVYQEIKKSVIDDTEEGYLKNIRWFDNPTGPAEFNFFSQVTDEGLSLYVGYGVILTFEVKVEGDTIGDDVVWVSPNTRFLEDLSREVVVKGLMDSLRITTGYEILRFENEKGEDITERSMRILSDTTITVVIQAESYTLSVKVVDENNVELAGASGVTVEMPSEILHYGDAVSVKISYGEQKYRILSAKGTYGSFTLSEFKFSQSSDNTYSICTFQMPNGDLSLTITLSEGYTLTISIPETVPHTDDNHLFGLSSSSDGGLIVSMGSGDDTAVVNIGLNAQKDVGFKMPESYGGNAITVSIAEATGGVVVIQNSKLVITNIIGDVTVELKISIEWKLTVNGSGYTVSNDDASVSTGSTVHTGDVLLLTTNPGHSFDLLPSVTGANITSSNATVIMITVDGTGDVTITGDAVRHSIIVTVVIEFCNPDAVPDVGAVHGVATVDGMDIDTGEVTNVDGRYSFTVEVMSGAKFSVTATVDGYIVSVYTGTSDEDTEVMLYAAERTTAEGPQPSYGSFLISTVSDEVNGEYVVADDIGLGKGTFTFGDRSVTIIEGGIVLSGFDGFVGTMVLYSYEMGMLTVVSFPAVVGA